MVELFLESYQKPPKEIILDLDVTDNLVHGHQEEAFFNPYYKGYCYAPLYIFCGHHLVAAKLRASNLNPAAWGLEELQRVVKIIRSRWQNVNITIRGDSAYSREDIMDWCESQSGIDYVFGLSQNPRLLQLSQMSGKSRPQIEPAPQAEEYCHQSPSGRNWVRLGGSEAKS